MTNLSPTESQALKTIVNGNSLTQPIFPEPFARRLLELHLVQQTLGGTLQATEKGLIVANTSQ